MFIFCDKIDRSLRGLLSAGLVLLKFESLQRRCGVGLGLCLVWVVNRILVELPARSFLADLRAGGLPRLRDARCVELALLNRALRLLAFEFMYLVLVVAFLLSIFNHENFWLLVELDFVLRPLLQGEFALDEYWLDIKRRIILLSHGSKTFGALLADHMLVSLLTKLKVVFHSPLSEHLLAHWARVLVYAEIVRILKPVVERILCDCQLLVLSGRLPTLFLRILFPIRYKINKIRNTIFRCTYLSFLKNPTSGSISSPFWSPYGSAQRSPAASSSSLSRSSPVRPAFFSSNCCTSLRSQYIGRSHSHL